MNKAQLVGNVVLWKNEHGFYTTFSNKKKDKKDEYIKKHMNVSIPNADLREQINNGDEVMLINSFISVTEGKDDQVYFKLVVTECEFKRNVLEKPANGIKAKSNYKK